jgi:hypothetical protein
MAACTAFSTACFATTRNFRSALACSQTRMWQLEPPGTYRVQMNARASVPALSNAQRPRKSKEAEAEAGRTLICTSLTGETIEEQLREVGAGIKSAKCDELCPNAGCTISADIVIPMRRAYHR